MSPILQDRLSQIDTLILKAGAHSSPEQGMCVMEAAAWLAGEPFSDHPPCTCPVLGAYLRNANDNMPDDETRTRLLKPLLPRLVGSKSTAAVEVRRSLLAADWLYREHTAGALDLVPELAPHAAALRALGPLVSAAQINAAREIFGAARQAAQASRQAARDAWAARAAWDAWDAWAARAAWDAWDAWDAWAARAAWAARDARDARDAWAARAVAIEAASLPVFCDAYLKAVASGGEDAASRAGLDACVALFAPTRDSRERSALGLVERMLAVTPESLDAEKR